MDSVRWKRLKEIVGDAIEQPRDDRAAYVAAACDGDAELVAEVESLLAHVGDDPFLDYSPVAVGREDENLTGRQLGPYRLTGEIGHGGMGTVYLAERVDGTYQGQVAVKAVRRGMDTEELLRRFRTERQILASLNHPNIARLLDGGALPDGRPYLVMEYVEGRRIDRYCDDEGLNTAERIRLFLQVCDAVSFAHQRLVVHRDIKPPNILVDASGRPKLLDFGIAKLLAPDEDAPATETFVRPMTPEYASPEQIRGQAVTTATDVYALGVVLYELLTGQRPHSAKERTMEALLEAIRKTDPMRPSAAAPTEMRRRLRGDLDVIVLTALRKEPERRYGSVEALAADLRRHLEGRAIVARGDSWSYRAGRFVVRNVVAVTAAALVAAALITGAVVATKQAQVARAERALAEKRQNDTLRLTNSMLFELFDGIDHGPTRARQLLVEHAFGYLDELSHEAPDDPRLINELASAYRRLGSLQGGTRNAAGAGGDIPQARMSYTKALRLRERLSRLAPEHFENRRELGILHIELGALANIEGHVEAALTSHRKGVALLAQAVAEQPRDREAKRALAQAHFNLANALGSSDAIANIGRPSEAAPHLTAALRLNSALLAERPDDLDIRVFMVALHNENAACLEKLGRTRESLEAQLNAIRIVETLVQRYPDSLLYRRELAVAYGNRASSLLRGGENADALDYTRKALPLYASIARSVPGDSDAERDLAIGHRNVGKALTATGDPAAALPHLREAIALLQGVTRRHPNSAFLLRQLAFTHLVMADALLAGGEPSRSLREVRSGIRICEALLEKDAKNMVALRTAAMSYAQAGEAVEALAAAQPVRWSEARTWYLRGRDAWDALERAGEISPANAKQIEGVREAIARCDAALAHRAS